MDKKHKNLVFLLFSEVFVDITVFILIKLTLGIKYDYKVIFNIRGFLLTHTPFSTPCPWRDHVNGTA